VFEFATGAFLHQQRYEIADLAGLEPGVLFADEGLDRPGRNVRKLVNPSLLDDSFTLRGGVRISVVFAGVVSVARLAGSSPFPPIGGRAIHLAF
jgi:hypothetical protein